MILVVEEPLAGARVGAVLRPTRSDWSATTPEVRALDVAAGPDWLDRWSAQGDLPVGSATITEAGCLPCEFVIHLSVCSREEPVRGRIVVAALQNGLRRAAEWGVRRLTTPVLGTGPGGLEPRAACRLMAPLLESWVAGEEVREVRVAAGDAAEREAARAAWSEG